MLLYKLKFSLSKQVFAQTLYIYILIQTKFKPNSQEWGLVLGKQNTKTYQLKVKLQEKCAKKKANKIINTYKKE